MNLMMLFAAMGAKTQQTVTFTSNTTWVAPSGVNLVNSAIGKGTDSTTSTNNSTVVSVVYHSSGTAGSGSVDWGSVQGLAEAAADDINDDGSASFSRFTIQAYPDATNTVVETVVNIGGAVLTSAFANFTGGWMTSGAITASGTSRVTYDKITEGTASTAFGDTFPGGTGGGVAPVTTFNNIAVTPGASYPIVVPTGGTVQIIYFA